MKNLVSTLFLTLISLSICIAQTAYITNVGNGSVSVVNVNTNTITGTISVGGAPYGIGVSPDGNKVYVSNYNSNTIKVINTSTNLVTATITVGNSPYGVRVNADGSKVYVTNYADNTVSVINTTSNTVTNTIAVGTTPRGLDLSPDGTKLYVANFNSNNISVINTATNTVTATITSSNKPFSISVSPNGSKVYVTNSTGAAVSVFNAANNTLSTTIAVGSNPASIIHSTDGSKIYVTNFLGSSVTIINANTDAVITTTAVSDRPYGIAMHPDGSKVYVVTYTSSEVDLINTSNNVLTSAITGFNNCTSFGNFMSIYQAVAITGPSILCSGNTATLSASGTGTYQWSTGETTSTITVTPNTTTTYGLTVTSPYGYVSTLTKTVTVGTTPTPQITGPNTNVLCLGNSTSLTASGGSSFLWSTGATTATINVAPTSTTTYSVTVTNSSSCTAAGSYGITVPAAISVTISGTNDICQGTSTILTANTPSGNYNYVWNNQSFASSTTVSPVINTTYIVTITDNNGCTATDDQLVTVTAPPSITSQTQQIDLCTGAPLALSVNATGTNLTYTWTWNGSPVAGGNGPTYFNSNPTPADSGTYGIEVDGTCGVATATVAQVAVYSSVQTSLNASICFGDSYPFNGQSLTNTGVYTGNFQTVHGCDSIVTLSLGVYGQLVPPITQTGNVLSVPTGAPNYQWLLNGVAIPGATTATYTASQSGAYTVQVVDGGCVMSTAVLNYVHVVGIDNVLAEGTVLYPNPTDGMIYLNNFQANTIEVFSTDGRLLMTANNASSLNMASLTAGTYLVRCYNNDTLATVRVIKY